MRQKPWPIIILAYLQIITPIGSLLLSLWMHHLPLKSIFSVISHLSSRQVGEVMILMPLAGWALLQVKSWSFPVFILALGWSAVANFREASLSGGAHSWVLLITIYLLNVLLVTYFSLPEIKRFYFQPKLRWWESKPRYSVQIATTILIPQSETQLSAVIGNLSVGGSMIEGDLSELKLTSGQMVELRFDFFERSWRLPAQVAHFQIVGTSRFRAGLQFVDLPWRTRFELGKLAYGMDYLDIPCARTNQYTISDLWLWLRTSGIKPEGWYLPARLNRLKNESKPTAT